MQLVRFVFNLQSPWIQPDLPNIGQHGEIKIFQFHNFIGTNMFLKLSDYISSVFLSYVDGTLLVNNEGNAPEIDLCCWVRRGSSKW